MYYSSDMEITMQHVTKYLDHTMIKKSICDMQSQQKELTKKKAELRRRIWRLNQIIIQANQLDSPLEDQ